MTWTGHTSLEVRVDSMVEKLDGTRELINRAYAVFVALDDDDRPVAIEPFAPQSLDERAEYHGAEIRRQNRLKSQP